METTTTTTTTTTATSASGTLKEPSANVLAANASSKLSVTAKGLRTRLLLEINDPHITNGSQLRRYLQMFDSAVESDSSPTRTSLFFFESISNWKKNQSLRHRCKQLSLCIQLIIQSNYRDTTTGAADGEFVVLPTELGLPNNNHRSSSDTDLPVDATDQMHTFGKSVRAQNKLLEIIYTELQVEYTTHLLWFLFHPNTPICLYPKLLAIMARVQHLSNLDPNHAPVPAIAQQQVQHLFMLNNCLRGLLRLGKSILGSSKV